MRMRYFAGIAEDTYYFIRKKAKRLFFEAVPNAVEGLDHFKIFVDDLKFFS